MKKSSLLIGIMIALSILIVIRWMTCKEQYTKISCRQGQTGTCVCNRYPGCPGGDNGERGWYKCEATCPDSAPDLSVAPTSRPLMSEQAQNTETYHCYKFVCSGNPKKVTQVIQTNDQIVGGICPPGTLRFSDQIAQGAMGEKC